MLSINCYANSLYVNCLDLRWSYSTYIIILRLSTFSKVSQRQKSVAVSTTKAEYMALSLAACQQMWLQNSIKEMGLDYAGFLLGDNKSSHDISENAKINSRTKHINIHYHFIREKVQENSFQLIRIPRHDNITDLLTKLLPTTPHHWLFKWIHCGIRGEVLV